MVQHKRSERARLRARAASGNAEACHALAWELDSRPPVRTSEAVTWWRKAAELGHLEAQSDLAESYDIGRGVRRDLRQSALWWRRAAHGGSARAQVNLGLCYALGKGVRKNRPKANHLYRRSAGAGNATAMFNLGVVYREGFGVARSPARSFRWFRKAAEGGCLRAALEINDRIDERGSATDRRACVAWLRRDACAGDADSQVSLGVRLFEGRGARRNPAEAKRWYRRAARQGNEHAWHNLGQMYRLGKGARQSWAKALACYERAALAGHDNALHWIIECASRRCESTADASHAANWLRRSKGRHRQHPLVRTFLAEERAAKGRSSERARRGKGNGTVHTRTGPGTQ